MRSRRKFPVRDATTRDAARICAIYNAAIAERCATFETDPCSPQDFVVRIGLTDFPLLVVEAAGEPIGWACLSSYSTRPSYAWVGECSVYVDPAARRRGAGTALTEALADRARGHGYHKLVGKLFTDNLASIRLVERCHFTTVGVHRRHGQLDGEWRDVLLVERLLSPD